MFLSNRSFSPQVLGSIAIALLLMLSLRSTSQAQTESNTPVNGTVPLTGIKQISAGGALTCALTTAGGVKCWGDNHFGQLGNGSDQLFSTVPVDVVGLSSGVKAISVGVYHVCALTMDGAVKCWGKNLEGQLGDGTYENRRKPVDVVGLPAEIREIATGSQITCALTAAGGVQCWGNDLYGKLGNGALPSSPTPTDVVGLSTGVIAIDASNHVCAVTTEGGVKCWGYNFYGEVGDGTHSNREIPVDVSTLKTGVIAVTVGAHHTCVLMTNGGVKCWGFNEHGELGDGTQESKLNSVNVTDLPTDVVAISASSYHTCALITNGSVKCWGQNSNGALGNGTRIDQAIPENVSGLSSAVNSVVSGTSHTCALMTMGAVKCWGFNVYGEVGDGTQEIRLTPVDVMNVSYTIFMSLVNG